MGETHDGVEKSVVERRLRGRDIFGTEQELADFLVHRTVIDQAKGMLMFLYEIDDRKAFELLRWRSQETNVKVRLIAQQLLHDLPKLSRDRSADVAAACDQVLLTVHERISAESSFPDAPPASSADEEGL